VIPVAQAPLGHSIEHAFAKAENLDIPERSPSVGRPSDGRIGQPVCRIEPPVIEDDVDVISRAGGDPRLEAALRLGRNVMAIWQDPVDEVGFTPRSVRVRRFFRHLRGSTPVAARVVITTVPVNPLKAASAAADGRPGFVAEWGDHKRVLLDQAAPVRPSCSNAVTPSSRPICPVLLT
jgi:hypothetical protein